MSTQVVAAAMLECNMGNAPTALMVLPASGVTACALPAATTMDYIPLMNILPFGMCQSMMNPMVLSATLAALGALTPMPCLPVTVAPWSPGSPTVKIAGSPALNTDCKLNCLWGGMITIKMAGQFMVMIP